MTLDGYIEYAKFICMSQCHVIYASSSALPDNEFYELRTKRSIAS